jgi:hypothetical protein
MKQQVTATPLYDLNQQLEGRDLTSLSVGTNRDILTASTATPLPHIHGMVLRQEQEFLSHIHHWTRSGVQEIALSPSRGVFRDVQTVRDGYLCVDSLSRGEEHNANVFDGSGNLLRSWHAGDAVEDVQVTPAGDAWVSYFDEGIFGSSPLSPQGLNCFNTRGEHTFGYVNTWRRKFIQCDMADCYALNVASNRDTWLCYYTQFPLVHLVEKQIFEVFEPSEEMIGTNAFALSRSSILFVGGYKFKRRIFWRNLITGKQIELEVVTEEGEPLTWSYAQGRGYVQGRGSDLFIIDGLKVWMLSLNDIGF